MKNTLTVLAILFFLFPSFNNIYSQSTTITYQGVLTDDDGRTITGTRSIRFDIFSVESSGSSLWNETHTNVEITKGLFEVELGSVTPFGTLDFSQELWLEITVNGTTLSPRIAFNSTNNSFVAKNIAGGAAGSIPYQSAESTTSMLAAGTNGQVLALDNGLPKWSSLNWIGYGNDIYYSAGNVGIGTSDADELLIAPFNVEGGIRYAGGASTASPGLLFYDPAATGTFKYYDNNGDAQVLGTGSINYTGTLWTESYFDYISNGRDVLCNNSLGVGFDIYPNMTFGMATIMLKENNLRILFDDTSQETYPNNDWQLTANSNLSIASGGRNYFAIEDITNSRFPFIVYSQAPSYSICVESSGNVGFGTNTPARKVHITDAMRLEPTTEPADPAAGDLYFDSTTNKLRCYDGTEWHDLW